MYIVTRIIWLLMVILVFISLIIIDTVHFFHVLTSHVNAFSQFFFFFEKGLFRYFVHLGFCLFNLLLICWILGIVWILTSCVVSMYFPRRVSHPFTLCFALLSRSSVPWYNPIHVVLLMLPVFLRASWEIPCPAQCHELYPYIFFQELQSLESSM